MELKQIRCTTCGESLSIETSLKEITCQACGNAFLMTQGIHLNSKTEDEIDTLKNLRIQLKRSVERQDIQSIEYHALEILKIIPDDYVSQYFFSYASYNLNKPKAFYEFLDLDIASTEEDKQYVVEHMKAYADIKEYEKLHQYVDRVYPEMSEVLTQTLNRRIQQEDHYSVVDRDVFICHRSTDNKKALKVLDALEADGHTCWISSRNLRPDDSINYWSNIEEAIENCRVFLVISSQSAMLSKDVQKELQLANKMNKVKIEYKIDESVHTTLFKRSFDGLKWIEAIKSDNIETLQERVLDALEEVETKLQSKQKNVKVSLEETKGDNQSARLKSLLIKLETQMEIELFEQASKTIEQIHEINYKNEYAWWAKLLIDNKSTTIEKLLLNADVNCIDKIYKSEIYSIINKLLRDSEQFLIFQKKLSEKTYKFLQESINDFDFERFEMLRKYVSYNISEIELILFKHKFKSFSEFRNYIGEYNLLKISPFRINLLKLEINEKNIRDEMSQNILSLIDDYEIRLEEEKKQKEKLEKQRLEEEKKQKEKLEKQNNEKKLVVEGFLKESKYIELKSFLDNHKNYFYDSQFNYYELLIENQITSFKAFLDKIRHENLNVKINKIVDLFYSNKFISAIPSLEIDEKNDFQSFIMDLQKKSNEQYNRFIKIKTLKNKLSSFLFLVNLMSLVLIIAGYLLTLAGVSWFLTAIILIMLFSFSSTSIIEEEKKQSNKLHALLMYTKNRF